LQQPNTQRNLIHVQLPRKLKRLIGRRTAM
jgi:hypothetical protein